MNILVDSCVLLDVLTNDPQWADWSAGQIDQLSGEHRLCINPLIYAEISIGFNRIEELEDALPSDLVTRLPLPWEAAFLAGKCFLNYRKGGGTRRSPLSDFYIGAHAAIGSMALLTRDPSRYRTYFPRLRLICP